MKIRFFFFISLYLFIMLLDAGFTYIGTPDLKLEANPLVSRLGLGWGALFAANLVVYCLYIAGTYYTFVKYKPPLIAETEPKRYVSQLFYGRPDKFIWMIYRPPTRLRPTLACFCYAAAWSLPLSRLFTLAEWLMHLLGIEAQTYYRLRKAMPLERFDVTVAFFLFLIMIFIWMRQQFRHNRRLLDAL